MKKIFLSVIITFLGLYSQEIIAQNLERELIAIMKQKGYELAENLYADVAEGNTAYRWKTFYANVNYTIIAFPEETGVNDIDAYLYDSDGSLLTRSIQSGQNYEILTYKTYTTRSLEIIIKNYDSNSSSYRYRIKFMIFYYSN